MNRRQAASLILRMFISCHSISLVSFDMQMVITSTIPGAWYHVPQNGEDLGIVASSRGSPSINFSSTQYDSVIVD